METFPIYDECGIRIQATGKTGTGESSVFYNPRMSIGRDFVVAAACASRHIYSGKRPFTVLDGFCASGIVGFRIKRALGEYCSLSLNDASRDVIRCAASNARANEISVEEFHNRFAESVLMDKVFDFVTIDPFGSPSPFLDALFRQLPKDGIAVLTATDTATLYGSAPQASLRHYGGVSCRQGTPVVISTLAVCSFLIPPC